MKRQFSKVTSAILLLLFMVVVPVNAAGELELTTEETIMQPMFVDISYYSNSFRITSNGTAVLASGIDARQGERVRVIIYLQRNEGGIWRNVISWDESRDGRWMMLSEEKAVGKGAQYRMKSYSYIYDADGLVESTSYTSKTITY